MLNLLLFSLHYSLCLNFKALISNGYAQMNKFKFFGLMHISDLFDFIIVCAHEYEVINDLLKYLI